MEPVKSFLAKYNITTHSVAAFIATLAVLYASVPQFHNLIYTAFQDTPHWFHEVISAGVAIYAFYHKPDSVPPTGEVK